MRKGRVVTKLPMGDRGFALIEVLITLAIVALLAGLLTPAIFAQLEGFRRQVTSSDLDTLKFGMIGNSSLRAEGVRTDFGYLGDLGKLPGFGRNDLTGVGKLIELVSKDGQAPFKSVSSLKVGGGWQGPYVHKGTQEGKLVENIQLDAFNQEYRYTVVAPTGLGPDDAVGTLTSAGTDRVFGTTDDLEVKVAKRDAFSRVHGYVTREKSGRPVQNVPVKIFFPDGNKAEDPTLGIIANRETLTNIDGFYEFVDTPFGIRSVRVEPRLVLAEGSARTKGNGQTVEFKATNYAFQDVSIISVKVEFTLASPAFFGELEIDNKTIFKAKADKATCAIPRKGSGEVIAVSPAIVVKGSAVDFTPVAIVVDQPDFKVPDIDIMERSKKAGSTVKVEINRFRDSRCNPGQKVDMTGVTFTVTLGHADGTSSIVTFTAGTRQDVEKDDDDADAGGDDLK